MDDDNGIKIYTREYKRAAKAVKVPDGFGSEEDSCGKDADVSAGMERRQRTYGSPHKYSNRHSRRSYAKRRHYINGRYSAAARDSYKYGTDGGGRAGKNGFFIAKLIICAQIIMCIAMTAAFINYSDTPGNYYNVKKLYRIMQNSREVHQIEEIIHNLYRSGKPAASWEVSEK